MTVIISHYTVTTSSTILRRPQ